jgi:hypothetical protein
MPDHVHPPLVAVVVVVAVVVFAVVSIGESVPYRL